MIERQLSKVILFSITLSLVVSISTSSTAHVPTHCDAMEVMQINERKVEVARRISNISTQGDFFEAIDLATKYIEIDNLFVASLTRFLECIIQN